MSKLEGLDRELSDAIDLLGYYISVEGYLSEEYKRLSDLVEDRFAGRLLNLMAESSDKNMAILKAVLDRCSTLSLAEPNEVMDGWSDIAPKVVRDDDQDDVPEALRRHLAFEGYLKLEYRDIADYFASSPQLADSSIYTGLSKVAASHEEHYSILKNLVKLSDIDDLILSIIE